MTEQRRSVLPLPTRRGLNREQAADYIGVGTTKFDEMVEDGRMPQPKEIDGRVTWDRRQLDEAYDRLPNRGLPGGEAGGNPLDKILGVQ